MSTEKIKIITNHSEYQKEQTYNLEKKIAISLLTNGKAIRIHRQTNDTIIEKPTENSEKNSSNKTRKKFKKYN
jgi:hypothetical protein